MKIAIYLSLLCIITITLFSCSEKNTVQPQSAKQQLIQSFTISIDGKEYKGSIQDTIITMTIPYGSDVKNIIPKISLSSGISISPSVNQAVDLSKPVRYTLKDMQGKSTFITVSVKSFPSELAITDIVVDNQIGKSTIDTAKHTITINVSSVSDLSKILIKSISSSLGTTVTPGASQFVDFSTTNSVTFLVKGMYNETKEWKITIIKEKPIVLSNEKDIIQIELQVEQPGGVIKTVSTEVRVGQHLVVVIQDNSYKITDVKVAKLVISSNASIVGGMPTTIDLSSSNYMLTIQAENGTTQVWDFQVYSTK